MGLAKNEMKAKPALPERVRSMEGLGVVLELFKNCAAPDVVFVFRDEPFASQLFQLTEAFCRSACGWRARDRGCRLWLDGKRCLTFCGKSRRCRGAVVLQDNCLLRSACGFSYRVA